MKEPSSIASLIKACRRHHSDSQKLLYTQFYNYAMSICMRYARNRDEAQEIVNDGFVKAFSRLEKIRDTATFKAWLGRIMVNASIDHFRKNERHYKGMDIVHLKEKTIAPDAISNLSEDEIMHMVQQLPPSYRIAFNLYVIEGYTHAEIAQELNISIGTSKSNLSKARMHLRRMLEAAENRSFGNYG